MDITRRNFLKVAAATAASMAFTGVLAGCSQEASNNSIKTDTATKTSSKWFDEEYLKKPAAITDIAETVEVDVVVVGAGNGGCIAAVSAADLGAKVALVEQGTGTITWAGEIAALNSKVAKDKFGVSYTDDEKNKIVYDICRYASYENDQRLVKLWADNSGRTMDWFTEKMEAKGLHMFLETDVYKSEVFKSFPVTHTVYKGEFKELGPNQMGSQLANPVLLEYVEEMGVQKFFRAFCTTISSRQQRKSNRNNCSEIKL